MSLVSNRHTGTMTFFLEARLRTPQGMSTLRDTVPVGATLRSWSLRLLLVAVIGEGVRAEGQGQNGASDV